MLRRRRFLRRRRAGFDVFLFAMTRRRFLLMPRHYADFFHFLR